MATIVKIIPCLWFDTQAEEAASFYVSIFEQSRIVAVSRYGEAGRDAHHKKPGSVMVVSFELAGTPFTALNGGPEFKFSEALSLQVMCERQVEIDHTWSRLSEHVYQSAARIDTSVGRCGACARTKSTLSRAPRAPP
ncbi:MAG: VOC family protein [Polyangiaceae bacterium]|nr:VOC family protein [Polyangiaceae bacterium]